MAIRDSDSYIFRKGVSPNTLSVISSKNKIYANNSFDGANTQIGVVSTFDPSEARSVESVRGIGFGDHIAELVPGVTDPMSISITRTALYLSNIYQVFGYKAGVDGIVRSLRHHRWPFDIRQEIIFSALAKNHNGASGDGETAAEDDDTTQAVITIYEACWITDYNTTFASDTALVQESVTINVSDILSSYDDIYNSSAAYSTLGINNPGTSNRYK